MYVREDEYLRVHEIGKQRKRLGIQKEEKNKGEE